MKNKNDDRISLSKEQELQAINDIMTYFEKERGESIGNMDALMILTFFKEKIGPLIYNCAIADAQKSMEKKVDELYDLIIWD